MTGRRGAHRPAGPATSAAPIVVGSAATTSWYPASAVGALRQDETHIWRAPLDHGVACTKRLRCLLSADELSRASRFHAEQHRDWFIASRGLLRMILARYLESSPESLRFAYGLKGKPTLAPGCGDGSLRFNVSHSGGMALYAITRDREIGVDVERIAPELAEGIAERFFSPWEVAILGRVPPDRRSETFFACWSRKEAYVKAKGDGLSLALDEFDVSLAPGEPAAILRTRGDPDEARRWSLAALDPGPGYAAAVAIEGVIGRLSCWEWPRHCVGPAESVCALARKDA
jgi:4'-phosphopantetheinyl transferase